MRRLHNLKHSVYIVLVLFVFTNLLSVNAVNNCTQWQTCDQCIQYAKAECAWCSQKDYTVRETESERCDFEKNHIKQKCNEIVNPSPKVTATKDDALTNNTKVKPQTVELELRPGQTESFDISVRTPENYPVDVYMLMDMSYSMKDNLPSVQRLGELLAVEMRTITSRFRVGFGTMVDKPVAPFKEPNKDYFKKKENKKVDGRHIVSPWVYKNVLSLTANSALFEDYVKRQNLSESVDNPDGWPDSLMQVAVCDKVVGWQAKDKARRLVVISTEEHFHIAGDGLLGGIVAPNDAHCKLGSSDTYFGTKMDYPSMPHLRHVLSENAIVPIFAVAPNSLELYKEVADYFGVEIGARADKLAANSTNIVSLIRDTYEEIGKTQTIFHDADDNENIKVEYKAQCLHGSIDDSGRKCEQVPIGKEVTFKISITLEKCPADGSPYAEFNITTALGDKVPVKVKYLCDCNCTDYKVENSSECSSNGKFECGKCYCMGKITGAKCDCLPNNLQEHSEQCIQPNETAICSNIGKCECGKCSCFESKTARIDGRYCECSDKTCDQDENGQLCGGPDRGECVCNVCDCKPGWSGPFCGCSNKTESCFDEAGVECSGRGKCECNKCSCEGKYTGNLCEECDGCTKGCSYYKDCVRCRIFKTGPLFQRKSCDTECNVTITIVDNVDSYKTAKNTKCITVDDEDDCTFEFVLYETAEQVDIFADEDKNCPREEGYLIIIIGVILGIVAIGAALLLIWKLLATIQDRREFAKFEREQQNARWDTSENPIFKQATTTFQNPTFGGKS